MSAEALTAAPAEAVEAVPAALQHRTVSDSSPATWAAQHRLPSTTTFTSFHQSTSGFSKPFVLPARLDRGVDILHDPVFNKVPRPCPSPLDGPTVPGVDMWHSLCPPTAHRAPAFRLLSVTGWACAA